MESTSILSLSEKLRTEADAYEFLEKLRWNGRPVCPHCGSVRPPYFLKPANGATRKTRTGAASERRVWKCADCRKQFSVLTGTIFHGTKVPVRTWVFVVFEMCSSKNGVAAREIERKYGLTPKTAWFVLHRIREAMKREPLAGLLSGRVVADETWFGGNPRNRHGGAVGGKGGQGKTDKTPILALVSRETGEVRSQVIPTCAARTCAARWASTWTAQRRICTRTGDFAEHSTVNHKAGEYVRGDVSTNAAEAYFSQLKRSIDGTHHHVSREHLPRYLAEFDFRFSTCKTSDTERMSLLAQRVLGRRLTYRPAS